MSAEKSIIFAFAGPTRSTSCLKLSKPYAKPNLPAGIPYFVFSDATLISAPIAVATPPPTQ